jgi:dihydrofolate reductase
MRSILSVVTSLDGFTTKGKEGPFSWASPEDQKKFADLKSQSDVVAMGPNTYREAREFIFTNLTDKPMRAVIRRGEDFRLDTVPDKLEFFPSIEEFLAQMKLRNKKQILWAGGAKLNGELFRRGLIDEVHQTIEPVYFGSGLQLAEGISYISLQIKAGYPVTLNEKGTLYIAYNVLKNK